MAKKKEKLREGFLLFSIVFFSFILGLIITPTIKAFIIENNLQKDNHIKFEPQILEKINQLFQENENEFMVCLDFVPKYNFTINNKIEITYIINKIDKIIISNSSEYVIGECEDNLIKLHSHPKGSCIFSIPDIYNFKKSNHVLNLVMCDINKIAFIKRGDYNEKIITI